LAWDAEAFVRSILFSATRDPDSHVRALAFGAQLDLTGLPARLPMLLLLALAFVAAARGEIGRYMAVLLVLATFVDFNPVFFVQYVAWLAPFVVLAAVDPAHEVGSTRGPAQASAARPGRGRGRPPVIPSHPG
jgi:hypothetical protein